VSYIRKSGEVGSARLNFTEYNLGNPKKDFFGPHILNAFRNESYTLDCFLHFSARLQPYFVFVDRKPKTCVLVEVFRPGVHRCLRLPAGARFTEKFVELRESVGMAKYNGHQGDRLDIITVTAFHTERPNIDWIGCSHRKGLQAKGCELFLAKRGCRLQMQVFQSTRL
jgi:hypothetical protein